MNISWKDNITVSGFNRNMSVYTDHGINK